MLVQAATGVRAIEPRGSFTTLLAFGANVVTVGAGFFQTLVTPGTNREKIQMLARELDQAIAKYGPESGVVDSLKQRMDDVQEEAELFGPDARSTLDEDEDLDFDEMEAALG